MSLRLLSLAGIAVAAVLASAPAAARAASAARPPVAVLPFKNLNDDPDTDWLKLGIAETMLSDLKKSGVTTVERDQVDKALGEMLLQGAAGAEEATAVQVGKLVGAKTVVLGSFQQAGKQLRINARFVEVETGVILDTAKTTGAADRVFALQDEIVARLLGKAPPARPKPKQPGKQVQAYKLYAMSLAIASDADRVGLLRKSLSFDPSFVYAAEELAALEKRLAEYAQARVTAGATLDRTTLAMLRDPAVPAQEKQWRAGQLVTRHLGERRCRAAIADAKQILAMGIPDPEPGIVGANESSLSTMVICHKMLGQPDLATQAGEELMRRFPAGAWFKPTERIVREILAWRKDAPARAETIRARFAELDAKPLRNDDARRQRDLERCWFPLRLDAEVTVRECRAFVERYAGDPAAAQALRQARVHEIEALGELGRWEEAVPKARAFLAEPEDGFSRNLRSIVEWHWAADALP